MSRILFVLSVLRAIHRATGRDFELMKIAVIGSGISGLVATWLLAPHHRVTLYEAGARLGGHANTIDVDTGDGPIAVDAGFVLFDAVSYTNLTALLHHLQVESQPAELSFTISLDQGRYEYGVSSYDGFFGQRSNLTNPRHWLLLANIARFSRTAAKRMPQYHRKTLGNFLTDEGYSRSFVHNHIH
ncbi:MAG: NAD(P)-binding protein, partial [Alphaproteobacteria bacterium]